MSPDSDPDLATEDGLARLVETTEARAYLAMIDAAPASVRAAGGFDAAVIAGAVVVRARAVTSSLNLNRVIGLGIAEPASEEVLDRIVAHYAEAGVPFGIELSPASRPAALAGWLRARRIRRVFTSAVLYRPAAPPPVSYAAWSRAAGLRIERTGAEHADALARISVENFRMPDAVRGLLAATAADPAWRHWIAFDGEAAVGASLSFVDGERCWLGWTSVLPSHRGRWVHAGIVAREIEDAQAAGCRWLTTETATGTRTSPDPAYYNLTRFGFRDAYVRPTYMGRPAAAAREGDG